MMKMEITEAKRIQFCRWRRRMMAAALTAAFFACAPAKAEPAPVQAENSGEEQLVVISGEAGYLDFEPDKETGTLPGKVTLKAPGLEITGEDLTYVFKTGDARLSNALILSDSGLEMKAPGLLINVKTKAGTATGSCLLTFRDEERLLTMSAGRVAFDLDAKWAQAGPGVTMSGRSLEKRGEPESTAGGEAGNGGVQKQNGEWKLASQFIDYHFGDGSLVLNDGGRLELGDMAVDFESLKGNAKSRQFEVRGVHAKKEEHILSCDLASIDGEKETARLSGGVNIEKSGLELIKLQEVEIDFSDELSLKSNVPVEMQIPIKKESKAEPEAGGTGE